MVTQLDYDLWQANFGATLANAGLSDATDAVPEPSSMGLLMLSIAAVVSDKWRQAVRE